MVSRKGINISVHYVVSINAMPLHICTLISQKLKRRTELYFILFLKLNDHPTRCFHFGLRRVHPNEQPIMPIEDRFFYRGRVRSTMASRKSRNV